MLAGLPLTFTAPWILAALALLPAIWWLLRLTPPRPREIAFPPTRLLLDIDQHDETPQRSPWWLTLLRLLLAAILIIALAGPIWRPADPIETGDEVLWVLLDNGWTSSRSWDAQVNTAEQILTSAEREGQAVLFGATAEGPGQSLVPESATAALERLRALDPRPFAPRRSELNIGLRRAAQENPPSAVIWLSDNTASDPGFSSDLADIVGDVPITVLTGLPTPMGLKGLSNDSDALVVKMVRHPETSLSGATVQVLDLKGLVLGEVLAQFDAGQTETDVRFELPSELRNDIARVEIAGEASAGAVQLLDDSWRRRTVGLISGQAGDLDQPLLSPLYYLERALAPFSDIRRPRDADIVEAIPGLIDQGISVLVLADVGRVPDSTAEELREWVQNGGTLLRFAGPRTAGGTDELIPVRLRAGDRSLGGSLSWKQPQHLAPFPDDSPFFGLDVPEEVTVSRQVLAEPTADLPDRTWAMLEDGTPLVTASSMGAGSIVLFHVTADSSWSNVPLSGVFLNMLRRILAVSNVAAAAAETAEDGTQAQSVLPPLRLLDGYGRFGSPPVEVTPVNASAFRDASASRRTPPGLYGTEDGFRALNLLKAEDEIRSLDLEPLGNALVRAAYPTTDPLDLRAVFFTLAFLLIVLDSIAVFLLAGGLSRIGLRQRAAGIALALAFAGGLTVFQGGTSALAQSASDELRALESTLETRLAYVLTGNPEIDDASASGLSGLTQFLSERTALEPGSPIGVDIARDELSFYSLIYWPIDPAMDKPAEQTIARIDTFMRNGGTILFDTRDHINASTTGFSSTPATLKLREILEDLDVPPLEPVPPDHVLTKAFYLLDTFPGRYATSPLWVESLEDIGTRGDRPVRAGDGVSPILITGNDFAAAWAITAAGDFMFPTVPNDPVQRDYAFRSGVNIVMYSLTGNYKADQVHIPALLERLGQ
ncbi:DUF4159 domain-containing protein [Roseibium denhamense]|uniref:N-terminal double-transmembrane domain-containing protein n=1 Tax=Roseibium denhamense TaxID=76305 RepID=A0ABY1NFX7_9HYPH|nr:DUF4159 domain-containing protein [Roseibium denhamense]MTI06350.1 DUF4159 domain-containing protein [Roseibium denhamense]SMP08506.1 N-terminal double-transmembrane domain-containing protein [Roseibium denhamense]